MRREQAEVSNPDLEPSLSGYSGESNKRVLRVQTMRCGGVPQGGGSGRWWGGSVVQVEALSFGSLSLPGDLVSTW